MSFTRPVFLSNSKKEQRDKSAPLDLALLAASMMKDFTYCLNVPLPFLSSFKITPDLSRNCKLFTQSGKWLLSKSEYATSSFVKFTRCTLRCIGAGAPPTFA